MSSILALDVGEKRVGVAISDSIARLPRPLITLLNDTNLEASLLQIITEHDVVTIVVGLPRDINGHDTAQTRYTESFVQSLQTTSLPPIIFQDEALTSQKAEQELAASAKPFNRADIDKLAACYILQDYLQEQH